MLVGWGASGPDWHFGTTPQPAGERPRVEAARRALSQPHARRRGSPAPPQPSCSCAGSPQEGSPAPSSSCPLCAEPDGGRQGPAGHPGAAHSHRAAAAGRGPFCLGAHDPRTRGPRPSFCGAGGHGLTGGETLKSRYSERFTPQKKTTAAAARGSAANMAPARAQSYRGRGREGGNPREAWPRTRKSSRGRGRCPVGAEMEAGFSAQGGGATGFGEGRTTPAKERMAL